MNTIEHFYRHARNRMGWFRYYWNKVVDYLDATMSPADYYAGLLSFAALIVMFWIGMQ